MGEIDTMKNVRFSHGEIDASRPWSYDVQADVYPDIWPGKRTDLASLERNAALYREEERRRFLRKLWRGLLGLPGKLSVQILRSARPSKHVRADVAGCNSN